MSRNDEPCPQCGGPLERDEADVGIGVIYGPAGCPACHWTAPAVTFPPSTVKADVVAVGAPSDLLDAFHAAGLSVATAPAVGAPTSPYKARERTDADHLADFLEHAADHGRVTPHVAAVAREIQRLQKYTRTTQAAFDDLAVAEERNVWLTSRVDELLRSNNDYLEQARAARHDLAAAKGVNAVLVRQLVTMREALEFYAEEGLSNDEREQDQGTTAEQALQDVLGYNRPPMAPAEDLKPMTAEGALREVKSVRDLLPLFKVPSGAMVDLDAALRAQAPMHHVTSACRAVGMCGAIDKPGKQACILPTDHEGAHGWDL